MQLLIDCFGGDAGRLKDTELVAQLVSELLTGAGLTRLALVDAGKKTVINPSAPNVYDAGGGLAALAQAEDGQVCLQTLPTQGLAWVDVRRLEDFDARTVAASVAEAFRAPEVEYAVLARGLALRPPGSRVHQAWGRENPEREAAPWYRTGWREPVPEAEASADGPEPAA